MCTYIMSVSTISQYDLVFQSIFYHDITHYHQNKTTGGHIATLIHIITRTRLQEDISLIHIILILIKPVFAIIPYWEKTILFLYSLIWNQRSTALEANMLAIIQTTWYHHTCTYSTKIVSNYGGCLSTNWLDMHVTVDCFWWNTGNICHIVCLFSHIKTSP
jgi:hypothetical protein